MPRAVRGEHHLKLLNSYDLHNYVYRSVRYMLTVGGEECEKMDLVKCFGGPTFYILITEVSSH